MISRGTALALSVPAFVVAAVFLLGPIGLLGVRAADHEASAVLAHFGSSAFRDALGGTIVLAGVSATASTALALVLAFALQTLSDGQRRAYLIVASVPLAFSGLVVAYGFLLLLGRSGSLTLLADRVGMDAAVVGSFLFSPGGLALAYTYFLTPRALLILEPLVGALSASQTRAARSLGAGWVRIATALMWPQLRPGILRALGFCFAVAAGAYSTALALAGADLPILPVLLLARISQGGPAADGVVWLALSLIALSLLATASADQLGAASRRHRKPVRLRWL